MSVMCSGDGSASFVVIEGIRVRFSGGSADAFAWAWEMIAKACSSADFISLGFRRREGTYEVGVARLDAFAPLMPTVEIARAVRAWKREWRCLVFHRTHMADCSADEKSIEEREIVVDAMSTVMREVARASAASSGNALTHVERKVL